MSLESAIATLVTRLEAVTARLEKVEKQVVSGAGSHSGGAAAPVSGGSSGDDSPSVRAYDRLVDEFVRPFAELSGKIAPEVKEQANIFLKAVETQRKMLVVASQAKKPSDADLQAIIKPTSDLMGEIVALRDKQRTSKFFNNLSTVSEGVGALGWVVVSPTPGPHVGDMRGGSEFYSNRILKEFKDKDQTQVDWVKSYNGFLRELQAYIKDFHTTGLTWNAQGGDAKALSASAGSASSGPKTPGGPPPPPPPGFLSGPPPPSATTKSPAPDTTGLFNEISKGTAITSGLRKVTDDQKTKNRKPEEKSSLVPAEGAKKSSSSSSKADKSAPSRPPKFGLDGSKWVVEFQQGATLEITETEPKQTVYIYRSENTTVQIKGKVNTIILDACKKVGVVFENAISGVEVVNSNSVEVQVLGKVPNIAIDKTAGIQLYLSKDTLASEIVSSNSSVMNVLIPGEHEGDDLIELAIPEQYKTIIKGNKLITESVQHV